MNEQLRQKFLNTKNKSWLVAKLIIRKKNNAVWNLSENIRISKQLKKYELNDIGTIGVLYEYLVSVSEVPKSATIYELITKAKEKVSADKFSNQVKETPAVDLMKYL